MLGSDLFLVSTEGYGLDRVHRCERVRMLRSTGRSDLLVVRITPPIRSKARDGPDHHFCVLFARHANSNLGSMTHEWPVYVAVAVGAPSVLTSSDVVADEDLDVLAWAEVYPTAELAANGLDSNAERHFQTR